MSPLEMLFQKKMPLAAVIAEAAIAFALVATVLPYALAKNGMGTFPGSATTGVFIMILILIYARVLRERTKNDWKRK